MFSTTDHGKKVCDSAGGLLKQQAALPNLCKGRRKAMQYNRQFKQS